jgi:hypothetical protein
MNRVATYQYFLSSVIYENTSTCENPSIFDTNSNIFTVYMFATFNTGEYL